MRPPAATRAAITRPPAATAALGTLLAQAGISLAAHPLIRIEPTRSAALAQAVAQIERYDWVVVTSAHAAAALAGALAATRGTAARAESSWPDSVRVAAIGPATAGALAERGIPVTVVAPPGAEHGPGLVAALVAAEQGGSSVLGATPGSPKSSGSPRSSGSPPSLAGRRVLYPGSDRARPEVPAGLRTAGAEVDAVEAYRNLPDLAEARTLALALGQGRIDGVVFTSPSNVEALVSAAGGDWPQLLDRVRVVAIGPATGAELATCGRPADVVAEGPDPRHLARALTGAEPGAEAKVEDEASQPRSRDRVSNE